MISNEETIVLSPFMGIYELVVPKDNILRQINELVDFSFILKKLKTNDCLDNGLNAIPPVRMFKYLLLKVIYDLSDVDLVECSKYENVRKAVYQINESMKEKFPEKTTSSDVADELEYCRQVISVVEKEPQIAQIPAVKEKVNVLKEIVEDYADHLSYFK